MHTYPHTATAFENTVVLKKGAYPHPISPFAGVVAPINPHILEEIATCVKSKEQLLSADLVVTFESSGNQIAAVVCQTLGIPCLIARKKQFELPNESTFSVATNYDTKKFYLYGDIQHKNIVLVDDVIASGSTIKNAIEVIHEQGARVTSIFAAATKNNTIGKRYQATLAAYDIPILSLVDIAVVNGKVVITPT